MPALLLLGVSACSAERYARPNGPSPRYEAAPLAPWDAGALSPEESPFDSAGADGSHADAGRVRALAEPEGRDDPAKPKGRDEPAEPEGSNEKVQRN